MRDQISLREVSHKISLRNPTTVKCSPPCPPQRAFRLDGRMRAAGPLASPSTRSGPLLLPLLAPQREVPPSPTSSWALQHCPGEGKARSGGREAWCQRTHPAGHCSTARVRGGGEGCRPGREEGRGIGHRAEACSVYRYVTDARRSIRVREREMRVFHGMTHPSRAWCEHHPIHAAPSRSPPSWTASTSGRRRCPNQGPTTLLHCR